MSQVWVKPWPNRQKTNRKHPILKILLKNRTKLHFLNLRISKRTTSFYFLLLQNRPNSRDCRFPCTLTHTIILFAYIGYNKRAPSTISSSQCHIPHIEIILVIMKFESGKPKHQLRFNFNTLLFCTGLLSQLKLRRSLYSPPPPPPAPIFLPWIVWRRVSCCQPEIVSWDAIWSACTPLASISWRTGGVALEVPAAVTISLFDTLLFSPCPRGRSPISKSGAFIWLPENQNQIRFNLIHELALWASQNGKYQPLPYLIIN